jgi:hypothetical protein
VIYYKIYFPIQIITVQNQTMSFYQFGMSFGNKFLFTPSPTPQTTIIFILLTIAVFSFVLQIVDFLFRDEGKKSIHQPMLNQNELEFFDFSKARKILNLQSVE